MVLGERCVCVCCWEAWCVCVLILGGVVCECVLFFGGVVCAVLGRRGVCVLLERRGV